MAYSVKFKEGLKMLIKIISKIGKCNMCNVKEATHCYSYKGIFVSKTRFYCEDCVHKCRIKENMT